MDTENYTIIGHNFCLSFAPLDTAHTQNVNQMYAKISITHYLSSSVIQKYTNNNYPFAKQAARIHHMLNAFQIHCKLLFLCSLAGHALKIRSSLCQDIGILVLISTSSKKYLSQCSSSLFSLGKLRLKNHRIII